MKSFQCRLLSDINTATISNIPGNMQATSGVYPVRPRCLKLLFEATVRAEFLKSTQLCVAAGRQRGKDEP